MFILVPRTVSVLNFVVAFMAMIAAPVPDALRIMRRGDSEDDHEDDHDDKKICSYHEEWAAVQSMKHFSAWNAQCCLRDGTWVAQPEYQPENYLPMTKEMVFKTLALLDHLWERVIERNTRLDPLWICVRDLRLMFGICGGSWIGCEYNWNSPSWDEFVKISGKYFKSTQELIRIVFPSGDVSQFLCADFSEEYYCDTFDIFDCGNIHRRKQIPWMATLDNPDMSEALKSCEAIHTEFGKDFGDEVQGFQTGTSQTGTVRFYTSPNIFTTEPTFTTTTTSLNTSPTFVASTAVSTGNSAGTVESND